MNSFSRLLSLYAALAATASAEPTPDHPTVPRFFGFEFMLAPYTVKWACGAPYEADIDALRDMIAYWPSAPGTREIAGDLIDIEKQLEEVGFTLEDVVGSSALIPTHRRALCAVALNLPNLTFDRRTGSEDTFFLIPSRDVSEYEVAFSEFWETIEHITSEEAR